MQQNILAAGITFKYGKQLYSRSSRVSFLINLYHWKISFTKKIKSPINPSVKSGLRKHIFQIRRRLIVFENVSIIKKFDNNARQTNASPVHSIEMVDL